jgi:membrane protease YdiL (CAAX protease family)
LVAGLLLLHQLALTLIHFVIAPALGISVASAASVVLTIFTASALTLAIVAMDLRKVGRARAVFCSVPLWDRATFGMMLLALVIAQLPLLYLAAVGKTVWQSGGASHLAVGAALRGSSSTVSGLGLLAATVVVAPAVEELLYRGYLLGGLVARMPTTVAVVVSAILFVMLHAEAANLVAALCLGVGTAIVAVRTRSVVPGLIVHVANNAFGIWYSTLG